MDRIFQENVVVRTRKCSSALNRTKIPGADYCVNPYLGCIHNCLYCYASFILKYHRCWEPWGSFVEVKANLPIVLKRQAKKPGSVLLGTVCDPYQPIEQTFKLSRQALAILGMRGFEVEVMTKSDLILRDLDLLIRLPNFSVEMTVTTLDEQVAARFEPKAPTPQRRLQAITELIRAGVKTTVFLGPLLPHFSDSAEQLSELLATVKKTGANQVLIDKLNYLPQKFSRLKPVLFQNFPEAIPAFEQVLNEPEAYTAELRTRAEEALKKSGLNGRIIF
jgi:DNA repair photolyase